MSSLNWLLAKPWQIPNEGEITLNEYQKQSPKGDKLQNSPL